MALGFISEVRTHLDFSPSSEAACSKPSLIPPKPANRSIKLILVMVFISILSLSLFTTFGS